MLVALVTDQRGQSIHLMDLDDMTERKDLYLRHFGKSKAECPRQGTAGVEALRL